jgi:hypothetical protein
VYTVPKPDHTSQVAIRKRPSNGISSHLALSSQLIEAKPTSPEPLGDDFLQPHKRPAADEEDIRRVEGDTRLLKMLETAMRWHRCDCAFQHLEQSMLDTLPQIFGA